jgi:hypothetical protein
MAQDGSSVGSSMARRRVGLDCTAELIDTSPALSGPTGHLHVTRARRQQSSGGAKFGKLCEPIPLASQSTHLDPGRIPPGSVWRVDALGHDALGAVRNSPALTEKIILPGDRDRLDHAARNMGERASAVRKQSSP